MDDDTQRPLSLYAQTTPISVQEILGPVYEISAINTVESVTVSGTDIESNHCTLTTTSCKTDGDSHTIVDMDPPPKKVSGLWSAGHAFSVTKSATHRSSTVKDTVEREAARNEKVSSWKPAKRGAVPMGIDPKLYMQNERTLLQWVKCKCPVSRTDAPPDFPDSHFLTPIVGIICAAVGTGIVNFLGVTDPAVRRMGILVTIASILFIVLGYVLYLWRGNKTKKRGEHQIRCIWINHEQKKLLTIFFSFLEDRGHYDSIPAVTFVCLVLVGALVVNLYLIAQSGSGDSHMVQSPVAATGPTTF